MNPNKDNDFPIWVVRWLKPMPAAQRARWDPPWTGHPFIAVCTHTHARALTPGQPKHSCSPHVYVFGLWEETGVPIENPSRQKKWAHRMQTVAWAWNTFIFSSSIIMK